MNPARISPVEEILTTRIPTPLKSKIVEFLAVLFVGAFFTGLLTFIFLLAGVLSHPQFYQNQPVSGAFEFCYAVLAMLPTIFFVGLFMGVCGFFYVHIFLAYYFLLRRIPDFWQHAPRNLLILTVCTSLSFLLIAFSVSLAKLIPLFLAPLGFWCGSIFLFLSSKMGTSRAHLIY